MEKKKLSIFFVPQCEAKARSVLGGRTFKGQSIFHPFCFVCVCWVVVVAVAFGSWFLKQEEMLYYTPKEQQFSNDSVFFLSASNVFFSFLILTFLPKVLYLEPAGKPSVLQVTGSQRVRHD